MSNAVSSRRGLAVTIVSFVVALVFGEALIALIVAGSRQWVPTLVLQWLVSVVVIAIGGYYLFGLPQIKAWEHGDELAEVKDSDFRSRLGMKILKYDRWWSFIIASIIGGPFTVGLATAYARSTTARRQTFLAAWILALFQASLYLGILSKFIH